MNAFRRGRGLVSSGLPKPAEQKLEVLAQIIGEQKSFPDENSMQSAQKKPDVNLFGAGFGEPVKQTPISSVVNENMALSRGAFTRGRGLRGAIQNLAEQRPQQDSMQSAQEKPDVNLFGASVGEPAEQTPISSVVNKNIVSSSGVFTRGSRGAFQNLAEQRPQRIVAENPDWDDDTICNAFTPLKIDPIKSAGSQPVVRGGYNLGRGRGAPQISRENINDGPKVIAPNQANHGSTLRALGSSLESRRNGGSGQSRGRSAIQNPANDFGDRKESTSEKNRLNERTTMVQNNLGPDRKPSLGYVPPVRSIEEIVKEDVEQSTYYEAIADVDEDVTASFAGFSTKHKHIVAIDTWRDANFDEVLYKNIVDQCKYVRPRKIQAHAIPLILEGSDLKGLAETGSGKTAAFMLPIISIIMKCKQKVSLMNRPAPYCIIIEPTRELCKQVYEQGLKFANGTGIGVKKAYGQFDPRRNRLELREGNGCDILCATPGRFKHMICDNWIDITKVKILVFDEADQLLENNFLKTLTDVIKIPGFPKIEDRQTLMFSATFPYGVQKLADETMKKESAMIAKGSVVSANNRIVQKFIMVDSKKKKTVLLELLREQIEKAVEQKAEIPRFLVFVSKKRTADLLSLYYSQHGIKATTINGDRDQSQRETALREFVCKDAYVLISTDVCARGIDIKNLDHVVNYDLPRFKGEGPKDSDDKEYDERPITYVQRIGRTGRLRPGTAISFFDELDDNDREFAPKLVELVRQVGQEPADFVAKAADDFARVSTYVPPVDPWGDEDDAVPLFQPANGVPVISSADNDEWC